MSNKIIRLALGIIVGLFSIVPVYFFLDLTPLYIAWCIFWACTFAFLVTNYNLMVRGMLFLGSSVAVGLLGVAYAKAVETPYLWAIEFISQIIVLVGSGVGSSFIASHYLNREKTNPN